MWSPCPLSLPAASENPPRRSPSHPVPDAPIAAVRECRQVTCDPPEIAAQGDWLHTPCQLATQVGLPPPLPGDPAPTSRGGQGGTWPNTMRTSFHPALPGAVATGLRNPSPKAGPSCPPIRSLAAGRPG